MTHMTLTEKLRRSTAGSVVVEAAIAAPLMLVLTMAAVETSRVVFANMTMQSVATGAAGELARDGEVDPTRIADFLVGADSLAEPFAFDSYGRVVVSIVEGTADGPAQILWQAQDQRPGEATSRIGVVGGQATLPSDLALAEGETVAVAEVFYELQPLLGVSPEFNGIYKAAVQRPRVGELRVPQ